MLFNIVTRNIFCNNKTQIEIVRNRKCKFQDLFVSFFLEYVACNIFYSFNRKAILIFIFVDIYYLFKKEMSHTKNVNSFFYPLDLSSQVKFAIPSFHLIELSSLLMNFYNVDRYYLSVNKTRRKQMLEVKKIDNSNFFPDCISHCQYY